jgi:hypothetical protein
MKKIISLVLFIWLAVSSAQASYISLKTSFNARLDKDVLKVLVRVINKGDESAYNVQAEITAAGKRFLAEKKLEVGVDQGYDAMAEFPLAKGKPGIYPLLLTMHYTDANQYPFSALTGQTFAYRAEDTPGDVFGRLQTATFWQSGQTKLTIKNLSDQAVNAAVDLITPRELRAVGSRQTTLVPARGAVTVDFTVENLSALNGSNYQVFAVIEYDKAGLHQTSIAPGSLKITESKNLLGLDYLFWFAALIILLLVFLAIQLGWVKLKK